MQADFFDFLVFVDIFGLFMLSTSNSVALAAYVILASLVVVVVFRFFHQRLLLHFIWLVALLFSLIGFSMGLGFVLSKIGMKMIWYQNPGYALLVYLPPGWLGVSLVLWAYHRITNYPAATSQYYIRVALMIFLCLLMVSAGYFQIGSGFISFFYTLGFWISPSSLASKMLRTLVFLFPSVILLVRSSCS
jgi:hypothetical protein